MESTLAVSYCHHCSSDETHHEVERVLAFEARDASERHARSTRVVAPGACETLRVPTDSGHRQVVSRSPKAAGKKDDVVKTLAFVIGSCIAAVGLSGLVAPSGLVWIAQHSVTSGVFYVVAAVRVAFGLVLVSAASASRAPRALRIMGYVIVVVGLVTALTGAAGIERARTIIDWWLQLGMGVIRVTSLLLIALGGFVAYACFPARRAV